MVNKITTPPTTSELIGTVNEIIDDKQDIIDSTQLSYYGTCDTATTTRDKIVVCPEFTELKTGVSIRVKFAENSQYNGVSRLNVNGTGLVPIYITGGATVKTRYYWRADEIVSFTYDGTYWVLEEAGIADTSYYGMTKLYSGAVGTSGNLALTAKSLNSYSQYTVTGAPVYSASSTYAVGDRVRYSYYTCECIVDIPTAEAWTEAHWKALDPLQEQIDGKQDTITSSNKLSASLVSGLATVATSGSYNDLSDKPTIPTVNNPTITFTQGGTTKGTITLNQSTNQTVAFDAGGSARNIGEIIQSTIPLTDAGLHLLDGAVISGDGVYGDFYNYIAGIVNTYPNLFVTEAAWQAEVASHGVCGKFVFYEPNRTVRLPKITGFIEGTTDTTALGDLIEAGLPNITGSFGGNNFGTASGAFLFNNTNKGRSDGNAYEQGPVTFDASRSSSIYGRSNTVQPQSIKVLYYIVIATSTKTDIQVDIDEIATDLNGKADTDLSNINASGKSFISDLAMPSSRYIDLTLGASGATYTAPANGWIFLRFDTGSGTSFITIVNNGLIADQSICEQVHTAINKLFIVPKGEYKLYYNNITPVIFRFVYAQGEA